ncbi:MAG: DNA-3-methyladenine glycosylase 2 family protein [Solirubrobacteraceae bacterium]|nr:DNA-3-methyladenine glycosylase 2 family protein [Solirubrobacteraceae bacterium]
MPARAPRVDPDALAVEVRVEVRPPWPFRLQRHGGKDGVLRCRDGVLSRLLHVEGEPAVVRVAQPARERVLFAARAPRRDVAEEAIARMRFAVAVDDDLRPFHDRFRFDPLIGRAVRALPHLRVRRRPEPFEALAWAICEQLIDFERASEIERRIVRHAGPCLDDGSRPPLRDVPAAAAVAALAPARLEALGLTQTRAGALVRAAREVASGRVDLRDGDHERGWARLRAIHGVGAWTVEFLALHGQGRYDQLPAGDLAYRKLVGRLRAGGRPSARADEDEVRAFFAPYGEWAGLAGADALAGASRVHRALAA